MERVGAEKRGQKGRLFIRWPSQIEVSMNDFPLLIILLMSVHEFMTQKKVITLHSTYVLQQLLEMNGRKLQRCFVYNIINTFWSINNYDHILSALLQFNHGTTLVQNQFIFLTQTFNLNIFLYKVMCPLSFSHRLHLYSWDGKVMSRKQRMGKYWLL